MNKAPLPEPEIVRPGEPSRARMKSVRVVLKRACESCSIRSSERCFGWTPSKPFNVQPQIAGKADETRQVRLHVTPGGKNNDCRLLACTLTHACGNGPAFNPVGSSAPKGVVAPSTADAGPRPTICAQTARFRSTGDMHLRYAEGRISRYTRGPAGRFDPSPSLAYSGSWIGREPMKEASHVRHPPADTATDPLHGEASGGSQGGEHALGSAHRAPTGRAVDASATGRSAFRRPFVSRGSSPTFTSGSNFCAQHWRLGSERG